MDDYKGLTSKTYLSERLEQAIKAMIRKLVFIVLGLSCLKSFKSLP